MVRKTLRVLDHIGIQVADMERAAAFYDAVLPTIGADRIMDFGQAIGYGIGDKPDFWIGTATTTPLQHESHIAFEASDREAVDAWFAAAVAAGAEVLHEPRVWPEYHPGYYGAFVRDPDGNNVEAVHHTFESPPAD
jgi:catechol 2,3-dioxygenase-like lactoylglutathione lyase family enzyme